MDPWTRHSLFSCALGALLGCGVVNVAVAQPETQVPVVTVSWQPTCDGDTGAATYFSLEVFAGGLVRYHGGAQAREVGERHKRIDVAEVRNLRKAADAFTGGRRRAIARLSDTTAARSYCIEAVRGSSESGAAARNVTTQQGRRFSSAVTRIVGERVWVCPARLVPSDQPYALDRTAYCSGSEWEPRLDAFFREPANCAVYHSVQLYDDGTLYYYASTRQAGAIRKRMLADAYYSLSRSQFERIVSLVRTFALGRSEMEVETLTGPHTVVGEKEWSDDPGELAQLQSALGAEAGIKWAEVPREDALCAGSGPSYVHRRSDRPTGPRAQGAR